MTNRQYDFVCKQMKENNIDITLLTNMVNAWLDKQTHVCEQEMMNYIIKNEPLPEEVERALESIFNLAEAIQETSPVAEGQMCLFKEEEDEG